MPANEKFLNDPASLKLALGDAVTLVGPDLSPLAEYRNGGIIDPKKYEIPSSTEIYTFCSYTTNPTEMLSRAWWVERKELEKIIRFSEVNKISMGFAVRLLCCLPHEWTLDKQGRPKEGGQANRLNFLCKAATKVSLFAWKGLARPASASAPLISPAGSCMGSTASYVSANNDIADRRCAQLCIPGLKFKNQKEREDNGAPDPTEWLAIRGEYQLGDAATWLYL